MKKVMDIFVLVAVAAMTLVSCQKNEVEALIKQEVHFTINAGIAETKTTITDNGDGTYTPSWEGTEELGVLFSAPVKETKKSDVVVFTNTSSGDIASFEGSTSVTGNGTFYSFYPADAFNRGYGEGDVRLDLKKVQYPTATSFDPLCDILVAKPYDFTVTDGKVVADGLAFKRIMSVLRIDLKTTFEDIENEFVESLTFTAGDVKIVGYARVFLDNPDFTTQNWASSGDGWNEVTAKYTSDVVSIGGAYNSVYLVIAPVTIPVEKELTFDIKTKNYNISKTITISEQIGDMNFSAGNVNKINLTINEENCEKIDAAIDYSGEYLIVNSNMTRAANAWANGNNLPEFVLTTKEGVIIESDGIENCKMIIIKEDEGYTIQDVSGKYLYAAGGNNDNHLKGQETKSYWTVEKDGANYAITSLEYDTTRNILRYNSQNKIFSCYASGQADVTLYKYSDILPDTTPRIILDKNSDSVEATATSYEFTYRTKNITGTVTATVKDGATINDLTATASEGKVTLEFAANETTEYRNATIILSYEGAADVEFAITQQGKTVDGRNEKTWSWAGGSINDFKALDGVSVSGIGTDYAASNAPYRLKLDTTGDYFTIKLDGAIKSVSVGVKMLGGANTSYLDVQGSADGETFTSVEKFTISGKQNTVLDLVSSNTFDSSYRYLKFYFTKGSNVGVGPISITYIADSGESGGETPLVKTYTLTISSADFNSTSYAANNNEKTSKATASDGSTMDVKWNSYQVMLQSKAMQWKKNEGYIYNSTDLGTITNIKVTSSEGTFTQYTGTTSKPTAAGNGGYFQIKVGNATGKTSEIVVTFQK